MASFESARLEDHPCVQLRPGRGRCYVAERDFAADEVVVRERACAMAISDAFVPLGACAMCGRVPDPARDRVFAASEAGNGTFFCHDCWQKHPLSQAQDEDESDS